MNYTVEIYNLDETWTDVTTRRNVTGKFQVNGFSISSGLVLDGDRTTEYAVGDIVEVKTSVDLNGRHVVTRVNYNGTTTLIEINAVVFFSELTGATVAVVEESQTTADKGKVRSYSSSNPAGSDFQPVKVSDITQTLEVEEGVYEVDSLSMTVEGLDTNYFNDYASMTNKPYVCVIEDEDTGDTLFHGPIRRESVEYNGGTRRTAFEVVSWPYMIREKDAPARSVFDTELKEAFRPQEQENNEIVFYRNANGYDLNEIVQVGSLIRLNTNAGRFRSIVENIVSVTDNEVRVRLRETPRQQTINAGSDIGFTEQRFNDRSVQYLLNVVDQSLWTQLNNKVDEFFNFTLDLPVQGGGRKSVSFTAKPNKGNTFSGGRTRVASLFDDQETIAFFLEFADSARDTDLDETGEWFYDVTQSVDVEADTDVEVVGRNAYGVPPTTGEGWNMEEIIRGIFNLPEYGVLSTVIDSVTAFNTNTGQFENLSGKDYYIRETADFPENPLQTIGVIQNTFDTFARFVPKVVGGLPRIDVQIIPREVIDDQTLSTLSETDVIEWTEGAAQAVPDAVVVRPNVDYGKPDDYGEVAGWYFDGIDDLDDSGRKKRSIPEGENVVEIEVMAVPAYQGREFTRGGPVNNDTRLKALAKDFYEFYRNLSRTGSATLARTRPGLLGNYVALSEVDIDAEGGRTLFVTEQSMSIENDTTEISGRLGSYLGQPPSQPVARISGLSLFTEGEITLSAASSYDPRGKSLTYEWRIDGSAVQATSILYRPTLTPGSYDVQLTVSNGVNTDSVTRTIYVGTDTPTTIRDGESLVTVEKARVVNPYGSGDTYGEIRLYPIIQDGDIEDVRVRGVVGKDLPEIQKQAGEDYIDWYPVTETSGQTGIPQIDRVTDANGAEYYRLRVKLVRKHSSALEFYVKPVEGTGKTPDVFPILFDPLQFAEFASQGVTVDINNNLRVSAKGDIDTRTIDGIRVETSPDGTAGSYTEITASPYDNPMDFVDTGVDVSQGSTVYVRITLIDQNGGDGETFTTAVANNSGDTVGSDPSFDSVEVTGAGTISGTATGNGEFLLNDTTGGKAELKNLSQVETDEILASGQVTVNATNVVINGNLPGGHALTVQNSGDSGEIIEGLNDLGNRIFDVRQNTGGDGYLYVDKNDGTRLLDVQPDIVTAIALNVTNNASVQTLTQRGQNFEITNATVARVRATSASTLEVRNQGGDIRVFAAFGPEALRVGVGGEVLISELSVSSIFGGPGTLEVTGITTVFDQIRNNGYSSGILGGGFVVDPDTGGGESFLEVDNLRVRGELRTHIFRKDIVRASSAFLYVSDSSTVTENFDASADTTLYTKENVFEVGDTVEMRDQFGGTVSSIELTIDTAPTSATSRNGQDVFAYTVTVVSGTATAPAGTTVVRTSGANILLDAGSTNAPFVEYRNGSGALRQRVGNLNGSYGYSSDVYGLAAGSATGRHMTMDPNDGLQYFNGGTNLAQFDFETVRLGPPTGQRLVVAPDTVKMIDDLGNERVTVEQGLVVLGVPATGEQYATFSSSTVRFRDGADTVSEWSGNSLTLGRTTDEHVTIDPTNGFRILDGNGNIAAELSGSAFSVGTQFTYDAATSEIAITGGPLEINDQGIRLDFGGSFNNPGDGYVMRDIDRSGNPELTFGPTFVFNGNLSAVGILNNIPVPIQIANNEDDVSVITYVDGGTVNLLAGGSTTPGTIRLDADRDATGDSAARIKLENTTEILYTGGAAQSDPANEYIAFVADSNGDPRIIWRDANGNFDFRDIASI